MHQRPHTVTEFAARAVIQGPILSGRRPGRDRVRVRPARQALHLGHTGMDIGSGLVIEAPQSGEPVMITPLAGIWQQNTVAIRRIV